MSEREVPKEPKIRLAPEVWSELHDYADALPGKQTLSNAVAHLLAENKRLKAELEQLKGQEVIQVVKPQMSTYTASPPPIRSDVSEAELAFASMF